MPTPMTARGIAVLAAAGTLLLCVLAAAPTADAATIYGCYKRSSGALRVRRVGQKCRRGEVKVAWNTAGPAGKPGANGKNGATGKAGLQGKTGEKGTAGANGAVAGYGATQVGTLAITATPVGVLGKELAPGSYVVSAKVEITATATEEGGVQVVCKLTFTTGTGKSLLDSSAWASPLVSFVSPDFVADSTLPLNDAVTLSSSGTVGVECETVQAAAKEESVSASDGQLTAVQTTRNS